MGKLLLSLLFLTIFMTSGTDSTLQTVFTAFSRLLDSKDTAKLCIIRQAPVRLFLGLTMEYGRRTTNYTVIREIAVVEGQMRELYESLAEVTTWTESIQLTVPVLRSAKEQLQQIVTDNPGQWDPEFPSLTGIWKNNFKARFSEIDQDLGLCYAATIPCAFMDITCHFAWFFENNSA